MLFLNPHRAFQHEQGCLAAHSFSVNMAEGHTARSDLVASPGQFPRLVTARCSKISLVMAIFNASAMKFCRVRSTCKCPHGQEFRVKVAY